MKSKIAYLAILGMLISLSSCAALANGENSSEALTSAPASSSFVAPKTASQSVLKPVENSTLTKTHEKFDTQDFVDFIEYSGFGVFISGQATAEQLRNHEHSWGVTGMLTWIMDHYYTGNNLEKKTDSRYNSPVYPIEELQILSEEVLGYRYDGFKSDIVGYYPLLDGFGPSVSGVLDTNSIQYSDGLISAKMDYSNMESSRWENQIYFEYVPDHKYCKYQFVRSEELSRNEAIVPDVLLENTVQYRVDAELNLRYGPGTHYNPPVTLIPAGTEVTQLGYMNDSENEWAYVEWGMISGWVSKEYITAVQ